MKCLICETGSNCIDGVSVEKLKKGSIRLLGDKSEPRFFGNLLKC